MGSVLNPVMLKDKRTRSEKNIKEREDLFTVRYTADLRLVKPGSSISYEAAYDYEAGENKVLHEFWV